MRGLLWGLGGGPAHYLGVKRGGRVSPTTSERNRLKTAQGYRASLSRDYLQRRIISSLLAWPSHDLPRSPSVASPQRKERFLGEPKSKGQ